jgi:type VI secretion system secreted protein Hcp
MAFDAFLKLDGIKGESKDSKHAGETEIYSFSFGAHNPTTIGSATTGAGAGKVSFNPFSFMKKTDSASPLLFQACCQGSHIATGALTLRKAGGDNPLEYLKWKFAEVFIDSIQWAGSSGGDDAPTESVTFVYGQQTIDYQPQSAKGAAEGGAIHGGWDVTTNKKA